MAPWTHQYPGGRGKVNAHQGRGNFPSSEKFPSTTKHYQFAPDNPTLGGNGDQWWSWIELSIRVRILPRGVDTYHIYELFQKEGDISRIIIEESNNVGYSRSAVVTFSPPPATDIWTHQVFSIVDEAGNHRRLAVELLPRSRDFVHRIHGDRSKAYPERMLLNAKSLDFCQMIKEDELMQMKTVHSYRDSFVRFHLDLPRRSIYVSFPIPDPADKTQFGKPSLLKYRFNVRLQAVDHILSRVIKAGADGETELIIPLRAPPRYFVRATDIATTHSPQSRRWHDNDSWFRVTAIPSPSPNDTKPVQLAKSKSEIDIGRWTAFRLVVSTALLMSTKGRSIQSALAEYNIAFQSVENLRVIPRRAISFWELMDQGMPQSGSTYAQIVNSLHLDYHLRYQLEVCISQDCINEYNITKEFLNRLVTISKSEAIQRLEIAADDGHRLSNPMDLFAIRLRRVRQLRPRDHVLIRTATVTPTTIRYNSPAIDMSNRVLRQYEAISDRFLRVRFTEERFDGKLFGSSDNKDAAVFKRVHQCLTHGIRLGDVHYEYLGSSNSQFRERSAYFFAAIEGEVSAQQIRAWMGDFSDIKIVAKCASRIGQCFSTTRAVTTGPVDVSIIKDVEKGKYNFTDGVGKISSFRAQRIASALRIPKAYSDPPSVFQFRSGGAKGILAVDPDLKRDAVHLRESQYKFAADEKLEIIRWSTYSTPLLNRQLITILHSLGVESQVFLDKLHAQMQMLDDALENEDLAAEELERRVDPNHMTHVIAKMVRDGFLTTQDPFTVSVLRLWRSWRLKSLKEKAGIEVEKGAFVFGCTDETKTLKGSTRSHIQGRAGDENSVPEIFLQIQQEGQAPFIVEGICIVARNPSLHPGDVRVVKAVNASKLEHIKNAVVFPQQGDRDIPSMCSGGDLDGDDYFVSWDPALLPAIWNFPPMNFEGPKAYELDRDVSIADIINFTVDYMRQDNLGQIANAHLATADQAEAGAREQRCLQLASIHSTAVDFPKTGVPASLPPQLKPSKYPHYMAAKRPKYQVVHSNSILGKLWDAVSTSAFHPIYQIPFDQRILGAYALDTRILAEAAEIRDLYNAALRRIMAQHEIETEFEVWTTFVLQHANVSNDYKFHEELGRLKSSLTDTYRELCLDTADKNGFMQYHFFAAMYTVTWRDVQESLAQQKERPLLSFPWLFAYELGEIAKRSTVPEEATMLANFGHNEQLSPVVKPAHSVVASTGSSTHDGSSSLPTETDMGQKLYSSAFEESEDLIDLEPREMATDTIFNLIKPFSGPHPSPTYLPLPDVTLPPTDTKKTEFEEENTTHSGRGIPDYQHQPDAADIDRPTAQNGTDASLSSSGEDSDSDHETLNEPRGLLKLQKFLEA